MKQDCFVYNGIQYKGYTGLIVVDTLSKNRVNTIATFKWFDTDSREYKLIINDRFEILSQEEFDKIYLGVWDRQPGFAKPIPSSVPKHIKVDPSKRQQKALTFEAELNIDGLLIAWIWYVFIMVVGVIFNNRIGIWILASYIFFNYRKKKLKEAGYK